MSKEIDQMYKKSVVLLASCQEVLQSLECLSENSPGLRYRISRLKYERDILESVLDESLVIAEKTFQDGDNLEISVDLKKILEIEARLERLQLKMSKIYRANCNQQLIKKYI